MFSSDSVEGLNCVLHSLLKLHRRGERLVGFNFHDVQLKFLAEGELGFFDEVNDSAAFCFDDFVADWQRRQVFVYKCVFVFWSEDF